MCAIQWQEGAGGAVYFDTGTQTSLILWWVCIRVCAVYAQCEYMRVRLPINCVCHSQHTQIRTTLHSFYVAVLCSRAAALPKPRSACFGHGPDAAQAPVSACQLIHDVDVRAVPCLCK